MDGNTVNFTPEDAYVCAFKEKIKYNYYIVYLILWDMSRLR